MTSRSTSVVIAQALWAIAGIGFVVGAAGCISAGKQEPQDGKVIEAMNRGVALMGQYQYGRAAQAFREALDADPQLQGAKLNLAISLFNRNLKQEDDLGTGMRLIDELLTRDPENLRALYFRGIILQHLGETDKAIECFDKVVAQHPEDGAAWYLLGLCRQRVERPAREAFLNAVKFKPHLYSAYYQLARIALREKNRKAADGYLARFKELRQSPLGESIELPQYNQMGELALVQPLPGHPRHPITGSRFQPEPARKVFTSRDPLLWLFAAEEETPAQSLPPGFSGFAVGDLNGDGRLDVIVTGAEPGTAGRLFLLLGEEAGTFRDGTTGSGLESVRNPLACALGDYDNDEKNDLFVACAGANSLWKGNGDGSFTDVTRTTGTGGGEWVSPFAMFLDADHDADLDILVCNTHPTAGDGGAAANQLLNNNADGTFSNIAARAGIACPGERPVLAVAGDIDEDRDLDLVIFRERQPARVFLNELSGNYRESEVAGPLPRGGRGAVLQDFNGDGSLDLLALGDPGDGRQALRLCPGDGRGHFRVDTDFGDPAAAAASWGEIRGIRAVDIDLDGDLDIALFSGDGHVLLNDGTGRFVFRSGVWRAGKGKGLLGAELFDFNGDDVADLLHVDQGATRDLSLAAGRLSLPPSGLRIKPNGLRGRDGRTRSPASGYGVKLTVRAGLREQTFTHTGLWGGANQSLAPISLGLGARTRADYVTLHWPDGVSQVEIGLEAGQTHVIAETQRKISSCPVLFSWNGQRFEFITDFAGVGGLGYYAAPGEPAPPQVLEHIKIEGKQLQARDGCYDLRITEPMEESAYIDRLELLAVDHPRRLQVYPDERLAIEGPPPTHDALVIGDPLFARKATGPGGTDCTERLVKVDRHYAYQPPLDRRFIGFCEPHTVELDFGDALVRHRRLDKLFLFIRGYIEYPYSQTVYAAGQAHVGWEPIHIEHLTDEGWKTVWPDAGVPGGMDRMMTVDLAGRLNGTRGRLRLTTNLEIYYDQVFLASPLGDGAVETQSVPLAEATLRRVGFAREYSPDGRMPLIYDYDITDATAPFHVLRGAYTRYGPVEELLQDHDDRHVLMGPGDEIALRFDASRLPAPTVGSTRSFILVSHSYCKDMDLYTATPQTLEPLPFRAMSGYPYPATEQYPDGPAHRRYRAEYNTRMVDAMPAGL